MKIKYEYIYLTNIVTSGLHSHLFLFQLAHEAFKMAQRLEPSYVAAWIGQVGQLILSLRR
jgi:hypothetical protein